MVRTTIRVFFTILALMQSSVAAMVPRISAAEVYNSFDIAIVTTYFSVAEDNNPYWDEKPKPGLQFGLGYDNRWENNGNLGSFQECVVIATGQETHAEMLYAVVAKCGNPHRSGHIPMESLVDTCAQFIINTKNWTFDPKPVPGTVCVQLKEVTPNSPTCRLQGNIILDHSTVALKEVEGNLAKTSISVVCDTNRTVTVRLDRNAAGQLVFPGGGYSSITFAGQALGTPVKLATGLSSIVVTSELHGITSPGAKVSSGTLIMEWM